MTEAADPGERETEREREREKMRERERERVLNASKTSASRTGLLVITHRGVIVTVIRTNCLFTVEQMQGTSPHAHTYTHTQKHHYSLASKT